jgi:hypothetical protein
METVMTSKSRSLGGAALMLLIIPVFAGLLACMPVPIGDPERSRIDPEMTGIWAVLSSEDDGDGPGFYMFEPYDKRTMLLWGIGLSEGEEIDLEDYDFSTYSGYEGLAANEKVHSKHVYADAVGLYKVWLTELGGEWFLTWENKGVSGELGEDPEHWYVFHVLENTDDKMVLRMVNGEAEPFEDVKKERRAFERVLKKHANDPVIYGEDDGDDFRLTLVRAKGPVREFLAKVADYVVED